METAARVVRQQERGPARSLALALLVLGGQAPAAALGSAADGQPVDGDEIVRSRAVLRNAQAHLRFGDVDAAAEALGAASHGTPPPWDATEMAVVLARLTAGQGHPAAARQMLATAVDRLPATATIARAVLREALAESMFLLGDSESAMSMLEELVPNFHEAGMAQLEASARITVGRIAWSVGETDVAVACFERARRTDPLAPIGDLVAVLAATGRDHDARAWLARLDVRPSDPAAPIDVLRARANTALRRERVRARRRGAPPRAPGRSGIGAHDRPRRLAPPPGTLAGRLPCWRAGGAAARPERHPGWVERVDALEPPPEPAVVEVPDVLLPLTDAERRVALAVSRGLTNKEAAAELYVSVKTVDSHLQRIYPKLFIRSRAELAALVNAALARSPGAVPGSPAA